MYSTSLVGRIAAFAASGAITLSIVMSSALYALPSDGGAPMWVQASMSAARG